MNKHAERYQKDLFPKGVSYIIYKEGAIITFSCHDFDLSHFTYYEKEECESILAMPYVQSQHFHTSNISLISVFFALHLNYSSLTLN